MLYYIRRSWERNYEQRRYPLYTHTKFSREQGRGFLISGVTQKIGIPSQEEETLPTGGGISVPSPVSLTVTCGLQGSMVSEPL